MMANYVHTPDRKVVDYGPGPLPPSWTDENGTYRLDAMSPIELAPHGWLLYVEQKPALTPHQKYGSPTIAFGATRATYTYPVVDMTPAEIAAVDGAQWQAVRDDRYQRLVACDWITTRAAETGQQMTTDWKTYRQALRDIPQSYTDPFAITWPVAPPLPGGA